MGHSWVRRVWRMPHEIPVVIVDLEQDFVALGRDHAKVVLAIGVVVGVEIIISPQRREDLALGLGPERRNRSREHDAAAGEAGAEGVVENPNAVDLRVGKAAMVGMTGSGK